MKKRFLVSLDAWLDTRLGAMIRFNPNIASKLVTDDRYFNRIMDDFEHYGQGTTEMWKNVYKTRDLDVLKSSRPTLIQVMVAEFIRDIYANSLDSPVWKGADLAINIWPYQLPEIDQQEIALAAGYSILPEDDDGIFDVNIRCVSISDQDLTLDEIRENWEMVIMYNFQDWFETHHQTFLKLEPGKDKAARLNDIYAPALFKEMLDRKEFMLPDGGYLNPFDETRRYLSLYFKLHFWEAKLFSLPDLRE